jgi:hypothetical protein
MREKSDAQAARPCDDNRDWVSGRAGGAAGRQRAGRGDRRGSIDARAAERRAEGRRAVGGGPNGAALGPDGHCYVCNNGGFSWRTDDGFTRPTGEAADYKGGSIQRVNLATGKVETLYTHCDGIALHGPNDIVFDAQGGFWFTDFGKKFADRLMHGAPSTTRAPTAASFAARHFRFSRPTASACRPTAARCTSPRPKRAAYGPIR